MKSSKRLFSYFPNWQACKPHIITTINRTEHNYLGEGRNLPASSQKGPVSKYCSSGEVVSSTTAPKEHESTCEGHFPPSRKMGRGSLRPPRGTEEWQKQLPWTPPPPLRAHPGSPPPPRKHGEQVQAGRRGSSRTEALSKAAQHGPARSGGQHSRASCPQAWRDPYVTQCHRLRSDPKPGL